MIDPNFTTKNSSKELLALLLSVDAEAIHNTESKYSVREIIILLFSLKKQVEVKY